MELNRPQSILAAMDQELDKFSMPAPGELAPLATCIDIVCKHLRELQDWAITYNFADQSAEIHYFKAIQPLVEGRLFYYAQALDLEQYLPVRSPSQKIAYYEQAYLKIEQAYHQMADHYGYVRLGSTHLDSLYFRRWPSQQPPASAELHFSDPRLRCPRGIEQAKLIGYQALEAHLDARIWFLQQPAGSKASGAPLTWHASRSALTELIYGLLEVKAFGSEAQDVKRISDYFQQIFHVQIANIYATYEDNRLRKKDRTPFLNSVKSALERRMDHDDLHAL